jgi:hypothetical protein
MSAAHRIQGAGWLFPTILCFGLSIIYFFEWRTSRAEQRGAASTFSGTVNNLNNKLVFESTQTRALLKSIDERLGGLAARMEKLSLQAADPVVNEAAVVATPPEPVPADGQSEQPAPPEDLPALPDGVMPVDFLGSLNLSEFFADPAFNPGGTQPSRVEWQRAVNMVDRAKARVTTLRSDIHLLSIEEMEKMREEGLYVDYEKDQKRHSEKGLYTTGEQLPGGVTRIYAFPEERYPQLYQMRREIETISDQTIRRLMALAQDNG